MNEQCRICLSPLVFLFEKRQLDKYDVKYFQCTQCHSAQTETPYWIEEAYRDFTFRTDTGMVDRTMLAASLTLALALEQNFSAQDICIDVGGGTGLLTRVLRDYGLNAFWNDRYAKNIFSIGFEKEIAKECSPKLMTAFEVFEHFANPCEEIRHFLETSPEFLFFSTKLYHGQDANWWYFLNDGQHVQFYSEKSLRILAQSWGYHFQTIGNTFHLFSKRSQSSCLLKKLIKRAPRAMAQAKTRWSSKTLMDHQWLIDSKLR